MKKILNNYSMLTACMLMATLLFACIVPPRNNPDDGWWENVVSTPKFSYDSGTYYEAIDVEITCATDGAIIYYTTDSSTPTTSSSEYTGAIAVSADATIKAIAVNDGMVDSDEVSAEYIIEVSLRNGLVGEWLFNGGASDTSGNANNGTVNGATLTTDRFGNADRAYSFDGNCCIRIPESSSFKPANEISLNAWVKLSAHNSVSHIISLDYRADGSWSDPWSVYMLSCDWNYKYAYTQFKAATYVDPDELQLNTWYFLSTTYDGENVKLYINGVEKTSGQLSGQIDYGTSLDLAIGNRSPYSSGFGFTGVIDDVRIYNRALTGTEIGELYHEGGWDQWHEATANAAFSARGGHSSVVYDNKMWVIGGSDKNLAYLNDVWYSTDGANWTCATSNAAFDKRHGHSSVVFDNKMWIIAGANSSTIFSDVWYSTDGANWTCATSSAAFGTTAAYCHSSVVYDNKIWVIGGNNGSLNNSVWYSSDGVNWTCATSNAGFAARFAQSSVVYNNKMWIIGGTDPKYNDVWYSTDGVNWTCATSSAAFPGIAYHASVVFNNLIWVIAGSTSSGSVNNAWYSSDGITWTSSTTTPGFSGRHGSRGVVYNNMIWLIGGRVDTSDYVVNDVWYYVK